MVPVSKTSTGVVEVRHNPKLNRYEVTWVTPNGKQGKTSVSIARWGKKEAFERASEIRNKKEAERVAAAWLGYESEKMTILKTKC